MKTYQALIADDEPLLCLELSELLTQCAPDIHVAGVCHDGNAALEFIKTHPLDIIFLDIQMPEQTGIAVARALAGLPEAPAIVFVTAHSGFALDAFGVNALDYLLKPFDETDLQRVLTKLRRFLPSSALPEVSVTMPSRQLPQKFTVEKNDRLLIIDAQQIQMIFAQNRQVYLQTLDGETFQSKLSLQEFESLLDADRFIRCHRNFIVNISAIEQLSHWFNRGYLLTLSGALPAEAPVSRNFVKNLRQHIQF